MNKSSNFLPKKTITKEKKVTDPILLNYSTSSDRIGSHKIKSTVIFTGIVYQKYKFCHHLLTLILFLWCFCVFFEGWYFSPCALFAWKEWLPFNERMIHYSPCLQLKVCQHGYTVHCYSESTPADEGEGERWREGWKPQDKWRR